MAESMESLFRRGAISGKQMGKLARNFRSGPNKTQASKMADFEGKEKDEGAAQKHAEIPTNEINNATNQARKKIGTVTKGGSVGRTGQVGAGQIDAADEQKPKFPAQGHGKGRSGSRTVGKIQPEGGQYGGGGQKTQ